MSDERLMTIDEVAAYLQVPKATIYAWNSRRTGPRRLAIGKHIRYRKADVDAWLDSQAVDDSFETRPYPQRR